MSETKPLRSRPEIRRWLSNVIFAFVNDADATEPTEAEITGELDVLEALVADRPEPCCAKGAKLTGDRVSRYKCPVHGWQEWNFGRRSPTPESETTPTDPATPPGSGKR